MIDLIPIHYEFTEPFGSIRQTSGPNEQLSLLCISNEYSFNVLFDSFLGVENREEFFDKNNSSLYNIKTIQNQNWSYPISFVKIDKIAGLLSSYETTLVNQNTALWLFLSQSNCIEVYSNSKPRIYKWKKTKQFIKKDAVCAFCGSKALQSKIIPLNYSSIEDGSNQEIYVHSMCLKSLTISEMMFHPDIEEEMEEIFI